MKIRGEKESRGGMRIFPSKGLPLKGPLERDNYICGATSIPRQRSLIYVCTVEVKNSNKKVYQHTKARVPYLILTYQGNLVGRK
jgi:hypothetical protein